MYAFIFGRLKNAYPRLDVWMNSHEPLQIKKSKPALMISSALHSSVPPTHIPSTLPIYFGAPASPRCTLHALRNEGRGISARCPPYVWHPSRAPRHICIPARRKTPILGMPRAVIHHTGAESESVAPPAARSVLRARLPLISESPPSSPPHRPGQNGQSHSYSARKGG